MDLEQMRAALRALIERMDALTTPPADIDEATRSEWRMDAAARAEFDTIETEATTLAADIDAAETRQARLAELAETAARGDQVASGDGNRDASGGQFRDAHIGVPRNDPYDLSTLRFDSSAADLRARAHTAIESMRDDGTPDDVLESADRTLRSVADRGQCANLFLHTGAMAYRSGFAKLFKGEGWALTPAEQTAVARAQSTTDAAGGFAIPFTLDPTVVLTNDSAINPIRRLATVKQITTNDWQGVTSAGATASWDAEAAEVSDDAVTLAQPSIPVHKMQLFIPFSVEIGMDWAMIDGEIRTIFADARDNLEATAHIKGTGSGQPTGLEVELDGGSSELSPATGEAFAIADVYSTQEALPPRYRRTADQATWLAALPTANDIRRFDTAGGANMWEQLQGGTPPRLLGWRFEEHSEVDPSSEINAAASEDNFILFVGDLKRYVIVDRIGMTIELVPHLFHTGNNRPSGQRGYVGWLRTGAESIDDNAFRVMSIPTTA